MSFLLLFLSSITISFFALVQRFNFDLENFNKSYDEKIKLMGGLYFETFVFINDNVEDNSKILFLEYNYFILGHSFLYPRVKCDYCEYSNDINLLIYLEENSINYLLISEIEFPLVSNTTLFTKIESESNIYLLKINSDIL